MCKLLSSLYVGQKWILANNIIYSMMSQMTYHQLGDQLFKRWVKVYCKI